MEAFLYHPAKTQLKRMAMLTPATNVSTPPHGTDAAVVPGQMASPSPRALVAFKWMLILSLPTTGVALIGALFVVGGR